MNGKSDKKSLFEYCPTVVTLLKINFLLYSLLFVIQWISTRWKSFSISKSELSTVIVFCDLREDVASLWRPRTLSSTWPAASRPPPGSGTGQAGGEKQRFNVDIEAEISLYIYWLLLLIQSTGPAGVNLLYLSLVKIFSTIFSRFLPPLENSWTNVLGFYF